MALITPIGIGMAMGISIGWEVSYVLEEHAVDVGCFYGFAILRRKLKWINCVLKSMHQKEANIDI